VSTVETCTVPSSTFTAGDSYTFEFEVTDSASTPESTTSAASSAVLVGTVLTAPAAPTIATNPAVDLGQTSTLTDTIPGTGTAPYSYAWLYSTNGGSSYSAATAAECATPSGSGDGAGATVTCSFATTGSTPTGSYLFELKVTDSATTPEITTSSASAPVSVNTALTAPGAPTPNVTSLDADQSMSVKGTLAVTGTPLYSWLWLVSVDNGSYTDSTYCTGSADSGSGAHASATEYCNITGNTLAARSYYKFELQVTDSASSPETMTSAASVGVTTSSQLSGGTPGPYLPSLDEGQTVELAANPSGGSGGYTIQWYSGSSASLCATPISGANQSTYNASPSVNTYYCYEVTDSDHASTNSSVDLVTVNSALTAPAPPAVSALALDDDQTLTVSGTTPSTGTPNYAWQWRISVNGGGFANATVCAANNGSDALPSASVSCVIVGGQLSAGSFYTFELNVSDSATLSESATSTPSPAVTVASALAPPVSPNLSATQLDENQPLSVTGTLPSSGTSPYAWVWMVSVNGGSAVGATMCAVPSGSGGSAAATETCAIAAGLLTAGDQYAFRVQVTDSASTPETQISPVSSTVSVHSALAPPAAPSPSATALDADQSLDVASSIPTTGWAEYSWQWLISVNGGSFSDATVCAVSSGAGSLGGAVVTCAVSAGALTGGDTYNFKLAVTDNATSPLTVDSAPSAPVVVNPALVAGTPNPPIAYIDDGQSIVLTANPSGGTSGYTYQWYSGATAAACALLASPISSAIGGTVTVAPASNTYYCYVVTDSATHAENGTSGATEVVVNPALGVPSPPTPSTTSVSSSQGFSVTAVLPGGGTPTYSWQWLVSVNGGIFVDAALCAVPSGSGASAGATVTCTVPASSVVGGTTYRFELQVTDSATSSTTSGASAAVVVAGPPSTSSGSWIWIALVAIVAAAAIGIFAVMRRRRTARAPPAAPPVDGGSAPGAPTSPAGTTWDTAPAGPSAWTEDTAPTAGTSALAATWVEPTATPPPIEPVVPPAPRDEPPAPTNAEPAVAPEPVSPADKAVRDLVDEISRASTARVPSEDEPPAPPPDLEFDNVMAELDDLSKEILRKPRRPTPPSDSGKGNSGT